MAYMEVTVEEAKILHAFRKASPVLREQVLDTICRGDFSGVVAAIVQLRRLYVHVFAGGTVSAADLSHVIQWLERFEQSGGK